MWRSPTGHHTLYAQTIFYVHTRATSDDCTQLEVTTISDHYCLITGPRWLIVRLAGPYASPSPSGHLLYRCAPSQFASEIQDLVDPRPR
ncbi:hypothetical protein GW17_00057358 [Ensete ventricosum]|nr:hypothetical protein GW17_00057358 [Ensete ventricosum]